MDHVNLLNIETLNTINYENLNENELLKVINSTNYTKQNKDLPLFFKKSILNIDFHEDYLINTKNSLKIIFLINKDINITYCLNNKKNSEAFKTIINTNKYFNDFDNCVLFINNNTSYYLDLLKLDYFKNIKMVTYEIYDNFEENFINLLNVNKCIDNNIIHYEDSKIMIIKELINNEKCKEIINFIENNKNKHEEERFGKGRNVTCDFLCLNKLKETKDDNLRNTAISFDKEIHKYFNKGINIYHKKFNVNVAEKDCGYTLRKHIGQTRYHSDGPQINIKDNTFRVLTGIIILNSDYKGSLFSFPEHNLNFKLEEGTLILFPPYWTHGHCVSELKDNTIRYSINTWFLAKFD